MSKLKGSGVRALGEDRPPSRIKHTFGNNEPTRAEIFVDSQGREILKDDQIRIVSESGNLNSAVVTAVSKTHVNFVLDGIKAKSSLTQEDVLSRSNRCVSTTAESEGRPIHKMSEESQVSSSFKTTLNDGPVT